MYTCQLFLTQGREISEDLRRRPKIFPVPVPRFTKHDFVPSVFPSKIRDFGGGKCRHLHILHGLFVSHIGLSLHIFGKCVITHIFQQDVRSWSVCVSWRKTEVFNPQALKLAGISM